MRLDLNKLWSRSTVLMRENLQLLGSLGAVFILLPAAAIYLVLPAGTNLEGPMAVLSDPASSEEAMQRASLAVIETMQPFVLWLMLLSALQHIGYGALMALLGPSRLTVGQAIGNGIKAIIPVAFAMLLYSTVWFLSLFLIQLLLMPLGQGAAAFIGTIVGVLIGLFLAARFSLTLPVMVIDALYNPVGAMLRSWRLTAGNKRQVFGFWLLIIVAYTVIFILFSGIGGLVAAIAPTPGSTALIFGLFTGSFALASGIVICACATAMLEHLSAGGPTPPAAIDTDASD